MELMMCRTLAEGGDGPESSGGVDLPPVLRRFMVAITNKEASLRPIQNSGQVTLDGGIPLVSNNMEEIRELPWQQTETATPVQNLRCAPLQPGDKLYC
eukprot:11855641-Alexandrium_andersonii.AAC.1